MTQPPEIPGEDGGAEKIPLEYRPAPSFRRHHPLLLIVLSFMLAFVFAVTWVVMMTFSLPESDGMHGQMPFQDPLVFPVMLIIAGMAGSLVCLPTYFALRSYRLMPAVAILAGTVLAEILVVTPISAGWGFLGSFLAYAAGLFLARRFTGALE